MSECKRELSRRYRRRKRAVLLAAFPAGLAALYFVPWWLALLLALFAWVIHEAWFADHQFYSPRRDYLYDFPDEHFQQRLSLEPDGCLAAPNGLPDGAGTLILEITVSSDWRACFFDPRLLIEGDFSDRQDFERCAKGKRYLNLTGQEKALKNGHLRICGLYCRLENQAMLHAFDNPDYSKRRLMVIAPHADDAELAAFGLYSRADEVFIVTLTQGEIEADYFRRFGLNKTEAARLKGRLRTWDSLAIPLWGGVRQDRCFQLGYYCLQLSAMRDEPDRAFGSRESGERDVRAARCFNPFTLPADDNGEPNWKNLLSDLAALLEYFRPETVVTPHPLLDPHPDHIHATRALREAVAHSRWKPETLLFYANHLSCGDRWPMGPAENGVPLPPCIETPLAGRPLSLPLDVETRLNKALALSMQHDLQTPPSVKSRLRRLIQRILLGRVWPRPGGNEFFRKAVRRHELFWLAPVAEKKQNGDSNESDETRRLLSHPGGKP
ncbi:MAG: PIG-L family deacetylase [Candidatus Accumulibacter sp.]|jgi:LmbE family N-acetylglucosaminyl deacetylase|nr:PIG-L family deacetylase [Accumulibacter sp.]